MRIFEEKQRFEQWWLFLIIDLTFTSWIIFIFSELRASGTLDDIFPFLIFGFLVLLSLSGIFLIRLETKIDSSGVTARFSPFKFFSKHFEWK